MDYGEVLSKAWRIVWKNKVLWIFGILASCARTGSTGGGGGGGGEFNPGGSSTGTNPFGPGFAPGNPQFDAQVAQWINTHLVELIVGIIVLFLVFVVFFWLLPRAIGAVGEAGLVRGAAAVDGGTEQLRFSELLNGAFAYFRRIFGLLILVDLAWSAVVLLIVLVLVALAIGAGAATQGVGVLIVVPLVCILIPVLIVAKLIIDLIVQLSNLGIAIDDLGIKAAVQRAWGLLKKELGPVLLIWLITAVAYFMVEIVIALPLIAVAIVSGITALVGNAGNFSWTPFIVAGGCCLLYLPVLLAASGLMFSYHQSVWTLTYIRLTRLKPVDPTAPPLPTNA